MPNNWVCLLHLVKVNYHANKSNCTPTSVVTSG